MSEAICVECGRGAQSLYTEYSHLNIRLTQCTHCKQFVDKYIEQYYKFLCFNFIKLFNYLIY